MGNRQSTVREPIYNCLIKQSDAPEHILFKLVLSPNEPDILDTIRNHVKRNPESINAIGYVSTGWRSYNTYTPLYYACYNINKSSLDIVKLLVELGANPGWAPIYEFRYTDAQRSGRHYCTLNYNLNTLYSNLLPMVINNIANGTGDIGLFEYLLSIDCESAKGGNIYSYNSLMTVCSLINKFSNLTIFKTLLEHNVNTDKIVNGKTAHSILCEQLVTSKTIQAKDMLEEHCRRVVNI